MQPDYCKFTFTYSISDLFDADSFVTTAITQDSSNSKKFSFFYKKDLAPLTQTQTVTVTVKSTSDYGVFKTPVTNIQSFDLTFKNPCLDTSFVEIVAPSLANYDVIVFADELTKTHPVFSVETRPSDHTLCGSLTYTATFDTQPVQQTGKPFAHIGAS